MKCRKLISLLLIIIIVFSFSFGTYQRVQADTVVTPMTLMALTAMAMASGITYLTTSAAQQASTLMWNSFNNAQKEAINNMIPTITAGVCAVPSDVWSFVMSYINSKYTVGTNTITQNWYNNYPPLRSLTEFPNQIIGLGSGDTIYLWLATTPFYYDSTNVAADKTYTNYKQVSNALIQVYSLNTSTNTWSYQYVTAMAQMTALYCSSADIYTDITKSTIRSNSSDVSVPYVAQNSVANPTYDYVDSNGRREVAVPLEGVDDWSWFNDKTQANIQNPSIDNPITFNPTLEGIMTGVVGVGNISADIKAGVDAQTQSIENINTKIDTLQSDLTSTKTIADTIASDVASTKASVESLTNVTTVTGELDWTPLRVAGLTFTQVFPFSLPWDLVRLIGTLQAEPMDPIIPLNYDGGPLLPSLDLSIDMTPYFHLFSIIRVFNLLLFMIGVVFATRQLMGGDV